MKQINLTQGKFAQVDDDDFERVNNYLWQYYSRPNRRGEYAKRKTNINGYRKTVYMHQEVLNITNPKLEVDHKDNNGLNNQKSNLRTATKQQNQANVHSTVKMRTKGKSKYKGVFKHTKVDMWEASVGYNGKKKYIGLFKTEEEAARAYDLKAKELFGEFAKLNF